MPTQDAIVLIDQGGHSTRAILYALNGQTLAQVSVPVNVHYLPDGRIEMALPPLLASLDQVLADIAVKAQQLGIRRIHKAALLVQRSSFLVCRKTGFEPLTDVISWMDTRNQAWINQQRSTFAQMQAISGLYPNAHYAISKIRWLLDNHPHIAACHAAGDAVFVPLAAYLCRYLTQSAQMPVDAVIASRTLLMDLQQQQWSEPLLALAGISSHAMPAIVASDYPFGTVSVGDNKVPVALCGGDQSFIAFSAGIDAAADYAFINVGSGAFVQRICRALPEQTRLLKSPLFIGNNSAFFALEGTVNAAATALDYLFEETGTLTPEQLEHALQTASDIPLYRNTLAGSGSPYWLAAAQPQFSFKADIQNRAVAIIESVIFALTDNLEQIQKTCPAQAIMISGGLSQLDGFCQRLADCSGLTVIRPQDHEASARGAAFFLLEITKEKSALEKQIFNAASDAALLNRYEKYQQLVAKLCANA